jgi:hypothetical protein
LPLGSAVHVLDGGRDVRHGPHHHAEAGAVTLDGSAAQGRFNANGPIRMPRRPKSSWTSTRASPSTAERSSSEVALSTPMPSRR